jgi:hypothetical protein
MDQSGFRRKTGLNIAESDLSLDKGETIGLPRRSSSTSIIYPRIEIAEDLSPWLSN